MQDTETASRVNAIIERIGRKPSMLVPVLQAAQEEFKYLPQDVMALIAEGLNIPASKVYGVATFYAHFTLEPKGKYVVRCCDGTACHVKGSMGVMAALRDHLGLKEGQKTTADGLFSFETVSCLGACGLAPVMVVADGEQDKVHGQATPANAIDFLKSIASDAK